MPLTIVSVLLVVWSWSTSEKTSPMMLPKPASKLSDSGSLNAVQPLASVIKTV